MKKRGVLFVAVAIGGGGLVFGSGYLVGFNAGAPPADKNVRQSPPPTPTPDAPLQDARAALAQGEDLLNKNRDAYEAAYLNRRYRVSGEIHGVSGRTPLGFPSSGEQFVVTLKPWGKEPVSEALGGSSLGIIDFDRKWSLAVRPGHRIVADCFLEEPPAFGRYSFKYCKLISSNVKSPPGPRA